MWDKFRIFKRIGTKPTHFSFSSSLAFPYDMSLFSLPLSQLKFQTATGATAGDMRGSWRLKIARGLGSWVTASQGTAKRLHMREEGRGSFLPAVGQQQSLPQRVGSNSSFPRPPQSRSHSPLSVVGRIFDRSGSPIITTINHCKHGGSKCQKSLKIFPRDIVI